MHKSLFVNYELSTDLPPSSLLSGEMYQPGLAFPNLLSISSSSWRRGKRTLGEGGVPDNTFDFHQMNTHLLSKLISSLTVLMDKIF